MTSVSLRDRGPPNRSMLGATNDASRMQQQKVMRLKVNRIALMQTLKVDHILSHLVEQGVVTDKEKLHIIKPKSNPERVRLLLNVLSMKGKGVDWYNHFRDALRNPEVRSKEVRRKYQILVEFLDNTIIHNPTVEDFRCREQPAATMKLPYYAPIPDINNRSSANQTNGSDFCGADTSQSRYGEDTLKQSMANTNKTGFKKEVNGETPHDNHGAEASDSGRPKIQTAKANILFTITMNFTLPNDFSSRIKEPVEFFQRLSESESDEDQQQLTAERVVLERMRHLEAILMMERRRLVKIPGELCQLAAIVEAISDVDHRHMYFKYLDQMKCIYGTDLLKEVAASLCQLLAGIENADDVTHTKYLVKIGFHLTDFLRDYGMYEVAEAVLVAYNLYLMSHPLLENWMAIWQSLIRIMTIRNISLDFKGADWAYNQAKTMSHLIKLMSFGKDLLDESAVYRQLSVMMLEQGSINPAYSWAQAALKGLEGDDKEGTVQVLCTASVAYAAKGNLSRAGSLAVQAVQQAKYLFGTRHPMYIHALIKLSHHLNLINQSSDAACIAQEAIQLCHTVYGGALCVYLAEAHQMAAEAKMRDPECSDDSYFKHAKKAWNIARDTLPTDHARIAPFRITMATSLLKHSTVANDTEDAKLVATAHLHWALSEANTATQMFKVHWGEYSLKTVHAYVLSSQIYLALGNKSSSVELMHLANNTMTLAVPATSPQMYEFKVTLGQYLQKNNTDSVAIDLYRDVINNSDDQGAYTEWMHEAYKSLIALLRATEFSQESEQYAVWLDDWLSKSTRVSVISLQDLHSDPKSYTEFIDEFDIWQKRVGKVKRAMGNHFLDS